MSRLDVILAILKFATIALSALFGAVALITEFRDKETGKITKWGRRALFGVIASSVVAASIQLGEILEHSYDRARADRSALEQLQRQEKILIDINRGLNPLTNVRASFVFESLRLEDPLFSAYVKRVRQQASALSVQWRRNPHFKVRGTTPIWKLPLRSGKSNVVNDITITEDSPLFPSKLREPAAYILLDGNKPITIVFFKTAIKFLSYPMYELPDISMTFEENPIKPGSFAVIYGIHENTFTMSARELTTDSKAWDSTGKMVSFLDLAGAQVLIDVPSPEPVELRPRLVDVMIWSGAGEALTLPYDQLIQHPYEHGIVYEYILPQNLDELRGMKGDSSVEVTTR